MTEESRAGSTELNNSAEQSALIAMSGGVDSSVAAYLMVRQGFSCSGCTMRLYENDMIGEDILDTCCSLKDTEDARAVCDMLGIPYNIYHYETEFEKKVIEPFVRSYERGETPNPCILCNRYLKFDSLYRKAAQMGFHYIVTGHYARIEEKDGHFYLKKALDLSKDQSYVLYDLTEEQLSHTAFPLGTYTKGEVRVIAQENGFVNSKKKESQDICFVPDGDYASMIRRYTGREYPPGDIVDTKGNVLGRHEGIIGYTVGQRRGLGVPSDRRLYVKKIDVVNNTVVLSDDEELYTDRFYIRGFHWITGEVPAERPDRDTPAAGPDVLLQRGSGIRCSVKVRYRHKEQPATVYPQFDGPEGSPEDGRALVIFDEPQRAVTAGQSAVMYDGDTVLGGGIIDEVI